MTRLTKKAMKHEHRWRRDVVCLAVLFLAVTLFHQSGVRPGHTFLPVDLAANNLPWRGDQPHALQNWLISDPLYQYYPFLVNAVEAVRDFQWPLWNPYIMLGHPALADPLGQPFYPPVLISALLLGPARGLAVALWLQALLAAGLTFGWLRQAGRGPLAATGGALVYVLGGYMVTWFETTFWLSTLSLLPGILWAFDTAIRQRRRLYTGFAGLLFGLGILGGQLQFMGTFAIFMVLYAVGRLHASGHGWKQAVTRMFLVLSPVLLMGLMIGAVAILPFSELLDLSRRATSRGLQDSLPLSQLITLFIPNFFGNPATEMGYWGSLNFSEATIYAGLVTLFLASLAPFADRRFFVRYNVMLVFVTLYIIVGGPGVSLFASVPGVKYLSLHRSAFILPLLLAFLAAATIDAPRTPWLAVLGVAASFLALLALAFLLDVGGARARWDILRGELIRALALLVTTVILVRLRQSMPARRQPITGALLALLFVDLFSFGHSFNPSGDVARLLPATPAIEYLQANVGRHRLAALQRNDQVTFGPNVPSVFRIPEAGGYSSLVIARYHQLVRQGDPRLDVWWMNRAGNMVTFSNPSPQLLDLFQVSHVASPEPVPELAAARAEISEDSCEKRTATVGAGEVLRGRFTVNESAINRIDLRLSVPPETTATGQLLVRLQQGDRPVLEETLNAASLQDEQAVTLYFAPERQAPGRQYVWEVSSPDADTGVALCLSAAGAPAISVYGSDWIPVYEGEIMIYERLLPLPRAYVVYGVRRLADDQQVAEQLLDPDFPLRRLAITAEPVNLPATAPAPFTPATIVAYEDTRVVVHVDVPRQGLLVLGDQFYPGWEARVDGEQRPLIRTNHIFRGVPVAPGEHEVVFTFRPQSLSLGLALTVAGLLAVVGLAIAEKRRFK